MTKAFLKNELTRAIEGIDDQLLLEALYTIINKAKIASKPEFVIEDEDWIKIEARKAAYESGKAKALTIDDVKKRFNKKFQANFTPKFSIHNRI